jgi:folate-binding protein YgfZ
MLPEQELEQRQGEHFGRSPPNTPTPILPSTQILKPPAKRLALTPPCASIKIAIISVRSVFRARPLMATLPLNEMNTEVAAHAGTDAQLEAFLEGVGVVGLEDVGWLRVTGEDRVRWLNGMTTNSIQELKPGEGNYNFFLTAQGRIQGDAYAFADADSILLETSAAQLPALIELLDRFIIMDDVELTDISPTRSGILCAGPQAAALLSTLGIETADIALLGFIDSTWRSHPVTIIHADSPLVPRFELWADAETAAAIELALAEEGAVLCATASLEHLRILEGTPRYGVDIRDRELPQETSQTRALHFAKGCYLGQEIVERIRSRGNVHRTFHAFQLTGDLPAPGTALESDGKPVGELTSVASIPLASGPVQLALGYLRREVLDRNSTITYPGGVASPVATPFAVAEGSA